MNQGDLLAKDISDLAASLQKLTHVLRQVEAEAMFVVMEAQMINQVVELSRQLQNLSETKEKDFDALAAAFISLSKAMESIGEVKGAESTALVEQRKTVSKALNNVEDRCSDFLSSIAPFATIEKTIRPPLEKLLSTTQEKRHLLTRKMAGIPDMKVDLFK